MTRRPVDLNAFGWNRLRQHLRQCERVEAKRIQALEQRAAEICPGNIRKHGIIRLCNPGNLDVAGAFEIAQRLRWETIRNLA